jgi:tetratricopeptide (TPR) repeat protein
MDPSDDQLFLSLFDIYNIRRDFQSAKETLEKGIITNPYSVLLANRLAKFYMQQGLFEKASETIKHSIKYNPDNEEILSLQREIFFHSNELKNESQLIAE